MNIEVSMTVFIDHTLLKVTYYSSMDYGVDTNRTFFLKELVIFTDFVEIPQTPLTRQFNVTGGFLLWLHKSCYQ